MSIERSFLPSSSPTLADWRSTWESAADRALVLVHGGSSTIRRAVVGRPLVGSLCGDSLAGQTWQQRTKLLCLVNNWI